MEVTALPVLARGIVTNRGSSGRDRATTRCAGEHAMTSKVRLEIWQGFRSVLSVCGCRGSWGSGCVPGGWIKVQVARTERRHAARANTPWHRRFIWRFDEDSAVRRVFAVVVDRGGLGWGVGWWGLGLGGGFEVQVATTMRRHAARANTSWHRRYV